MRLLFIRHGDPDYEHDCLTEKGRREAEALAEHSESLRMGEIFVSPLGRAQETASYSLKKLGKTGTTREFLQEFITDLNINGCPELIRAYPDTRRLTPEFAERKRHTLSTLLTPERAAEYAPDAVGRLPEYEPRIVWDMVPSYFTEHPELMGESSWRDSLLTRQGQVGIYYDYVTGALDGLLAEHGYVREGRHYRVERSSEETLTFFCHLGAACALLSHLLNASPYLFAQVFAFAPTSVTEVVTEEREKGIAAFRALRLGDISHLALAGEEPSFSARFCERFENEDQRH